MRNFLIGAAFAAAAMFCVFGPPASAQHAVDPTLVHPGAIELTAPSQEPSQEYARLTAARTPVAPAERDTGNRVDFTEIVAALFLGLVAFAAEMLRRSFKFLPDQIEGMLLAFRFDHLLENGFNNWAEKKATEIRARGVTADLKNDAIASMVRYGRGMANKLVDKNGGIAALEERALSRVDRYIDELLQRWTRQKDNIAQVAAPIVMPPAPAERPPAAT